MRAHRRYLGLPLLLVAMAMISTSAAQAEPVDPNDKKPVRDEAPLLARVRESVDYLVTNYKVSESEALRRLQLQARSVDIANSVRKAVGDELLDVQLDQNNGGVLTFLTSTPDAALRAVKPTDLAEVRMVQSKYTGAQLAAAEAEMRGKLTGQADVEIGVDRAKQSVEVHYGGGNVTRAAQVRALAGLHAANGVPVEITTYTPPTDDQQRDCSILECDAPMRGGLRLHVRRDDGSWGSCTSGFNVRGSNGWVYMLTAGHCVTGRPGPKRQYMFHNGLPAVWEKNSSGDAHDPNSPADGNYFENNYPRYDYSVLPYQTDGASWPTYWMENRWARNLVQSQCVTPSNQTCYSGGYAIVGIHNWADIQINWIVCATGTGTAAIYPDTNGGYTPGTRCGQIKSKTMVDYRNSGSGGRGLKADICSRPGDSGGPLFSQLDSRAYGILSGGPSRSGGCNMSHPDEYGVYSPLSEILSRVSGRTGIGMSVISSYTG